MAPKLLIFLALFVAAACASDVVVLTPATFDSQVATGNWLVELYGPFDRN